MSKTLAIGISLTLVMNLGTLLFASAELSLNCQRYKIDDSVCRSAHIIGYPVRAIYEAKR